MSEALDTVDQPNAAVQAAPGDPNDLRFWLEQPEGKARFPETVPEAARLRALDILELNPEAGISLQGLFTQIKEAITLFKSPDAQKRAMVYVSGYPRAILEHEVPNSGGTITRLRKLIQISGVLSPESEADVTPPQPESVPKPSSPPNLLLLRGGLSESTDDDGSESEASTEATESVEEANASGATPVAESTPSEPEQVVDTTETETAEPKQDRPVHKYIAKMFEQALTSDQIQTVLNFEPTQRHQFMESVTEIFTETRMRISTIPRRTVFIECLIQGMSTRDAQEESGMVDPAKMYVDISRITEIFASQKDKLQEAVEVAAAVEATEKPEESIIENQIITSVGHDYIQLFMKLLPRERILQEAATVLALHFTGGETDPDSHELWSACIEMRQVIDGAVDKLRRMKREDRQNYLTREDTWLFDKFLGNPKTRARPCTFDEVLGFVHAQGLRVSSDWLHQRVELATARLVAATAA